MQRIVKQQLVEPDQEESEYCGVKKKKEEVVVVDDEDTDTDDIFEEKEPTPKPRRVRSKPKVNYADYFDEEENEDLKQDEEEEAAWSEDEFVPEDDDDESDWEENFVYVFRSVVVIERENSSGWTALLIVFVCVCLIKKIFFV